MTGYWIYDRADRLQALIDRARECKTFLLREACDHIGDRDARDRLFARLAIVRRRIGVLCKCARTARRDGQ